MNDRPVQLLHRLIEQYGDELADDPRRTEALLNDHCPTYRRELFVLVNAQRQDIPTELRSAPKWLPNEAVTKRLTQRLQDRLALSEDAAEWAVESWAYALNLRQTETRIGKVLQRARSIVVTGDEVTSAKVSYPDNNHNDHATTVVENAATAASGRALPSYVSHDFDDEPDSHTDSSETHSLKVLGLSAAAVATIIVLLFVFDTGASSRLLQHIQGIIGNALTSPQNAVEKTYTLPRIAWVEAGPLLVRQGPGLDSESTAMLQGGESVQVTQFSADSKWAHILSPYEGWVSNDYLLFIGEAEIATSVRLGYERLRAVEGGATINASPEATSNNKGNIEAGKVVVAVASTVDGEWKQVVSPREGWIQTRRLQPAD